MSNEVYDFNIGHSTAYAYAKASGDLPEGMTPEEYGELLASYATVGQTAVTAAQTATTKASEAATSATTATNKASEATTAATTATNKAAEAQADADAAALDASQALSAASTATSKATEATTAAATATSAKTDAVAANTAAQSAKTAAQTAQTGAETAAASVAESAAQIQTNAGDISQLKSELTAYTNKENIAENYRQGYLTTGGVYNTSNSGKSYAFDISGCTKAIRVLINNNNMCRYAFYTKAISEVTASNVADVYVQYSSPFPHDLTFDPSEYSGYNTLIISTDYNNQNPATILAYEDLATLNPEKIRLMYNNVGKFNMGTSNKMATSDAVAKMANYRDFYAKYQPNILGMEEFPLDSAPYIDSGDSVAPNVSLYPLLYPYSTTPYQNAVIKSDYAIVEEKGIAQSISGYYYGLRGSLAVIKTPEGRTMGVLSTVFDIGTGHYNDLADRVANRTAQMTALINLLAKYDYACVLVDTNMESEAEYTAMKEKFEEAGYSVANGGFFPLVDTCPAAGYKPIDNIFIKGNAKIKSVVVPNVLSDLSSDHLPIIADVLLY